MRLAWLIAVLLLAASGCSGIDELGCRRRHTCIEYGDISYSNTTDERLFVHFNQEGSVFPLEAGETRKVKYIRPRPQEGEQYDDDDDPFVMEFYDERGCEAMTILTTVRKIRDDHDSSFVIMPADLKPPQERYDCSLGRVPSGYQGTLPPASPIIPTRAGPTPDAAPPAATDEAERPIGFLGQRGIYASFPPADLDLYRALLPPQLDMPESPEVLVFIADFHDVNIPVSVLDPDGGLPDMVPFLEGAVFLQCEYEGRTGMHSITMPASDGTASEMGRRLGFPDYLADEITLAQDDGNWIGRVVHGGRAVLSVSFTPAADAAPREESARREGPFFQLVPPGEGPEVNQVDDVPSETSRVTYTDGTATIEADPEAEWAGLIPEGPVAAFIREFIGVTRLVS